MKRKEIAEILNRICPNEKAHRFVSRHGNTYCASCGIKPALWVSRGKGHNPEDNNLCVR